MRRSIAFLTTLLFLAVAFDARAENPAPLPLDVSGWYLRGNFDDPEQQSTEGRTYLQPNILGVLPNNPTGPARYSMSETR
ncbi:MAG: hypothetical protein AB7U86_14880 [Methylocystis sp.]|uniref:hypothetical protein n=1 Tax=Methylocystis sp. TaxID=1911079 RepID=UPI003D0E0B28